MKLNKYISRLESAAIERQVEDVYNDILKTKLGDIQISYPYSCDGYFETNVAENKPFRCICEFKYDINMSSKIERSKVLAQVVFYLKRFEKNGKPFPNVVFIGDKNECFCLHSNELLKYLDFENVDWSKAPSSAGENADLVIALSEDASLNIFVWDVNVDFDFDLIYNKMVDLASNTRRLIRVTEHNVDKVFKFFCEKVLKKSNKISANDLVALFFGCITDHENYYLHPSKKNILVAERLGNIMVNSDVYNALMNTFAKTTSPKEKARLAALSDRLIEDTNRRRKGEFYTPTNFVDYSHGMIAEKFGENWTDEYVVWDCACGTKNLTRDRKFKELYCSTLEQAELDVSKQYNPEATSFVFDFLNGSDDELFQKAPGLKAAFEQNKKIIFFINPPYGSGTGSTADANISAQAGTAKNMINTLMKSNNIGGWACANLYTQFLYRISYFKNKYNLTNYNICVFCPPGFLIGQKFEAFRKYFLNNFKYVTGMQFDSKHFTDVSFGAITFTIWESGQTQDKNNFLVHTVDDGDDGLHKLNEKIIYNLDNANPANKWIKENISIKDKIEYPTCTSALNVVDRNGTIVKNSIGEFNYISNNVFHCGQSTNITTMTSSGSNHFSILPNNFDRIITYFSARLICEKNAYNQFDEFMVPDETHEKWPEFVNDSLIYSIFSGKSQQSSLRNVQYHNKSWNIKNEFFWMSNQEMKDLAEEYEIDEMYSDANGDSERFVYRKLQNIRLSAEAQAVLDAAKDLVRKSMKYRKFFNDEHPEIQIQNWDCGIYQIKQLCKEYLKDDWKKFEETRKALANKIRPMIKELGFLK